MQSNSADCVGVVGRLVQIATSWARFDLAGDEWEARATVQTAREVLGFLEEVQARETEERDARQRAMLERMRRERMTLIRQESPVLLRMLNDLVSMPDPQARGRTLELLLARLFELHEIAVTESFRRNGGGEQIDGAFRFEGWHSLVETKWQERLSDIRQLDSLYGKLARSGTQTLGMFLTMNGFSPHVVPLLQQNPEKRVFLMDGRDLLQVLDTPLDLREVLRAKLVRLNLHSEPWFSVEDWRMQASNP